MTKTIFLIALGAAACGPSTKPAPHGGADEEWKEGPEQPGVTADPFCDGLAVIVAEAPGAFEKLRAEERGDRIWGSTVSLDGEAAEISELNGNGTWAVGWEPDGEGMDQVRTMKKRIAACPVMAGFTLDPFEPSEDNDDPDFQTVFAWRATDGTTVVELESIPRMLWLHVMTRE